MSFSSQNFFKWKDKKIYKKEYENDTTWRVGDVEVSWEHLTNVSPEKLKDPALKKQIKKTKMIRYWKELYIQGSKSFEINSNMRI